MSYDKEFGMKRGAIHVGIETYTATAGYRIYMIVPDPSATLKAIPTNTSLPYMTLDRTVSGGAVEKFAEFTGRYSSVVVSAGSCDVYEEIDSDDV